MLSIPTPGAGIGAAGREVIVVGSLEGPPRGGSSRTATMPGQVVEVAGGVVGTPEGPLRSGSSGAATMPGRVVEDEAAAMLSIPTPGAGIGAAGREGIVVGSLEGPPRGGSSRTVSIP